VHPNVRDLVCRSQSDQRQEQGRTATFSHCDVRMRHRSAAQRERDGVLAWIARFPTRQALVRMRLRALVLVDRRAMVVLGMVVTGVAVHVQRRDLSGRRENGQPNQDRGQTVHKPSVCNGSAKVNGSVLLS
jgi:hypothetical protein